MADDVSEKAAAFSSYRTDNPISSPEDVASMTHTAEKPNPALPYVEAVKGYVSGGGVPGAMRGFGATPPSWMEHGERFLGNPNVRDAFSMIGGVGKVPSLLPKVMVGGKEVYRPVDEMASAVMHHAKGDLASALGYVDTHPVFHDPKWGGPSGALAKYYGSIKDELIKQADPSEVKRLMAAEGKARAARGGGTTYGYEGTPPIYRGLLDWQDYRSGELGVPSGSSAPVH